MIKRIKYSLGILAIGALSLFYSCNSDSYTSTSAFEGKYAQQVDSLLKIMTLDEKIGQLVLFTSHWDVTGPVMPVEYETFIREGSCGNIFNAHSAEYNRKLQEIAVNETRLGIPLLFGYDVIHGHRTIFPISLGEAASWDTLLIEKASRVAAVEATASGVNWTFAPMVDISVDPRWGRVSESAGEDPFLGSQIARARVRGFQGDDLRDNSTLLACVKHFAAYGAPQAGRDYHTVDMSDRTLRDMYIPPYQAAIEEGVASVMTAFNEVDGIPATASSYLMTDILRKEWGFNGFVVTDYTAVEELIPHGVAADEKEAALLALNAGVDMDMQSSSFREYLKPLVEEGKVKESEIDKAVKRILEAKFALGLFEDPYRYFDSEREKNLLMHQDHLDLAYETALHSMVLLKNSHEVLPLSHGESLAVIGPLANSQRDLLGSWIADGKWDSLKTILEALKEENKDGVTLFANGCGFDDTDRSGFPEAMKVARSAGKIILVMGEPWDWSGEASSRTNIDLPEIQKELIREIASLGKPVVLVLLNGRPLALEEEYEFTDAILEAWYPGTMGAKAIADVIFGNFNPSGKLPMTFPRNIGQVPVHYNMKNTGRPYEPEGPEQKYRSRYIDSSNEPLFPFGFGLSYTSFKYDEIRLGTSQLKTGNDLKINVIITNTGKREGTEVVQLYIRDLVGSVTRPVKELKGFRKILLQPGESKEIEFLITSKDLSFYRADMTFGTEPGEFEVFAGGNSRDVISTKFQLLE